MPNTTPLAPPAATEELLTAVRSLFTCTRKVRSWVSDAGQVTVLGVVDEQGEAKVSTIAAALLMDVSTVSRALTALCKDGLVQWRPDASDGRSHLVSCTPDGRARLVERRAQMIAELDQRLADWPAEQVAELSSLLNRFVASLLVEPDGASVSPSTLSAAKESA